MEGTRIAEKDVVRVNERVRAREVMLIGADGEQLGTMSSDEARTRAQEAGLDLVEVAPNARPPVCRIMDYGRYKYEQKKKSAAAKAKGKGRAAELKEVKMRPSTDDHDLEFKLKNARRFLVDGDKVKITVMFRGREMAHKKNGYDKLDQVRAMLGNLVTMEGHPQLNGRFLSMLLVPNREAVDAVKKAEAAEAAAAAAAAREAGEEGSERSMRESKKPAADEASPAGEAS